MLYVYGMLLRGFSPMCQPSQGLVEWEDSDKSETGYHSILKYDRKLTSAEVRDYELEYIGEEWRKENLE